MAEDILVLYIPRPPSLHARKTNLQCVLLCSVGVSGFLLTDDHRFSCSWTVISADPGLPCLLREVLVFDNWQKIPVHPDFLWQLSFN